MPSPRHARVRFDAPDFAAIEATRAKYKDVELSPRTLNSYAADWRVFEAWTEAAKRAPIPASEETVEFYCTDLLRLGRKISTVERHCFAIQHMHTRAGFESPYGEQVKRLLSGARRLLAQMPTQKAALETADLKRIVRKLGHKTPTAARNSALLLFGFASALRRSTLAELRPEDLKFTREGVLVTVRHEKQDRKGDGRLVAVPCGRHATTCPVQALDRWLDVRGRTLAARGWTQDGGELFDVLERLERAGCTRYVVTDVRRDGTLTGPNVSLLLQVCQRTERPVIASGGVSTLDDLRQLAACEPAGIEGVIVGKALYAGAFTVAEALATLREPA